MVVRWRFVLAAATAGAVLAAPAAAAADYRAEIRRTSGGVPHVKAGDHGSLGYGYGFAYAQDQLCTFAEVVVTVAGERSRWFGPDGSYGPDPAARVNNLQSDFFFARVRDTGIVERLARRRFPHGPSAEVRATVRGFAAGYNAYLRRTGRDRLPDRRCRGERWVRPITPLDVYRRVHQLSVRASSGAFIKALADAQPPAGTARTAAAGGRAAGRLDAIRAALAADPVLGAPDQLGSNAYAFGRAMTASRRGLVLANPHFPWSGADRFYQVHLTIPGELDVTGAALQGMPAVSIGFNRDVAWTHTVSTGRRFTPYELDLAPGDPTTYLVDGERERMRRRTVRVRVRGGGTRSHTFYETRWGPVLHFPTATLNWTSEHAYALADVNWENFRLVNLWPAFARATSVGDLRRANARLQANPWTNTIAADRAGDAYYADESVVPQVDAERQKRCSVGARSDLLLAAAGLVLLDGSRAACAWGSDDDAITRGIFGPRSLPRLRRSDYVANANDSHWLANPRRLLTGYARIIGPEASQRSLRTRLTFLQAEALRAVKVDLPRLRRVMFANRNLSAELARDSLVAGCRAKPLEVLPSGQAVDVSAGCEALARWGLRANLDSNGAVLWRELWARLATVPWREPFDPARPLTTPTDFDGTAPAVGQALAATVQDLRDKGIALDVALRELQREMRGAASIPIHGCPSTEGCFNVITSARDAAGRYDPWTGSSFVMLAEFGAGGRVSGRAVLSYSQSENPRSPHFADQTNAFAAKRLLPMRFTEAQIRADPAYERRVVRGSR
jgi:acyl-homoserine-lactone acylase